MKQLTPQQEKFAHTCDACKHYTPSRSPISWQKDCGSCALIDADLICMAADKIIAGCEGGGAWIDVGPKFGCIHWCAVCT